MLRGSTRPGRIASAWGCRDLGNGAAMRDGSTWPHSYDGLAEKTLRIRQVRRRGEYPVRELRESFGFPANAEERLDFGIERREIRVRNRPVVSESIAARGAKLVV